VVLVACKVTLNETTVIFVYGVFNDAVTDSSHIASK
jgi:hypothetical protein